MEKYEFMRCKNDVAYFAETYVHIMDVTKGYTNFKLNKYQKQMIYCYNTESYFQVATPRQTGKTTMGIIILLHQSLFFENNFNFTVARTDHSHMYFMEICERIIKMLPEFLKSNVKKMSRTEMTFENGSVIKRLNDTFTERGKRIVQKVDNIYVDEYDFVEYSQLIYRVADYAKINKIFMSTTLKSQEFLDNLNIIKNRREKNNT